MAMGSSRSLSPLKDRERRAGELAKFSRDAQGDGLSDLRLGDPCDLGSETFNVVLLLLESAGGDEHGEVGVLDTELLDLNVEPGLDLLPDRVRLGSEDVATRDVVVAGRSETEPGQLLYLSR
jgi:hypothetical protein